MAEFGIRPPMIGDVIAAARVLLAAAEEDWGPVMDRLLRQAQVADRHRRIVRRPHPDWGNGSLMSAAAGHARSPEPFLTDLRYLRAMICVLERLAAAQLSFVSAPIRLYDIPRGSCGDEGDGRSKSEDGGDRSGLAADQR